MRRVAGANVHRFLFKVVKAPCFGSPLPGELDLGPGIAAKQVFDFLNDRGIAFYLWWGTLRAGVFLHLLPGDIFEVTELFWQSFEVVVELRVILNARRGELKVVAAVLYDIMNVLHHIAHAVKVNAPIQPELVAFAWLFPCLGIARGNIHVTDLNVRDAFDVRMQGAGQVNDPAAFKRAVGRLLKQKKIVIKEDGIYSL